MTSMVSRADVHDELVKAGIKSRLTLSRLMLVIDGYARAQDIPLLPDPRSALLSGESDIEEKITRCLKCNEVKEWAKFPLDRRVENNRRTICKSCEAGENPVPDDLFLTCHGPCGERRHASEFYRRRNRNSYSFRCKVCTGGAKEEGALYRCRRCKAEKPLDEFPASKQAKPMLAIPCSSCEESNPLGEAGKKRWVCPACHKIKYEDHFPPEKRANPRISMKCNACSG